MRHKTTTTHLHRICDSGMMRTVWMVLLLLLAPLASQAAPMADTVPPGVVLAPADDSPAAIRATLALDAATWYNDQDGDKVFDSLMTRLLAAPATPQKTIVTFVEGTDVDAAMEQVADAVAGTLADPVAPRHVYHHYGGFAADLDLRQVQAIAQLDAVRQVEWSQPGTPELDDATADFGVDAVQDLLTVETDDTVLDGVDGTGSVIAVMDTGFDGEHVDLQGKSLRFIDWSDDGKEKEPYDSGSHGTHVASIAAGLGKGDPKYKGVAPGADLVGFQISSSDTKAAAIASVDWILEHQDHVPVGISTISFGFGITSDGTDALELAMDKLWEAGVVPFKSTGNSGPEEGTVTIPGGARGILGTASMVTDSEGGFRLSGFSSRGPTADDRVKPDIAAPGQNIMAAEAGSGDGYVALSGTSMASPFAAGVAALVLQADPSLEPEDLRRILFESSHDWGPSTKDIDYGAGRIDALQAVQQALLERAVRESWDFTRLGSIDVQGPTFTVHAHGVLTADEPSATFMVNDTARPVAITVIHNGTEYPTAVDVPLPLVGTTTVGAKRIVTLEVIDPDGNEVRGAEAQLSSATSRQQTISFATSMAGEYTLQITGVEDANMAVFYDVAAGLPPVDLASVLPGSAIEYAELHGGPLPQEQGEDAPGPGVVLSLVAALGAALVVLRRRD